MKMIGILALATVLTLMPPLAQAAPAADFVVQPQPRTEPENPIRPIPPPVPNPTPAPAPAPVYDTDDSSSDSPDDQDDAAPAPVEATTDEPTPKYVHYSMDELASSVSLDAPYDSSHHSIDEIAQGGL